jgi:predicted transglutaminase-like cysteine proteinase
MNMKKWVTAGLMLLLTAVPANAYSKTKAGNITASASIHSPAFGVTLPPIGYVNFCARNKAECREAGTGQMQAPLSNKTWSQMLEVNKFVNGKIAPVADMDLYNTPERWAYPTIAGDCEDYVLLKKRYLEGLGFPPETLLITVLFDENGEGHAVLMVRTDGGDFILDNRRDEVLRWSETGYEYIKRQSQKNPRIWVSMSVKHNRNKETIAGAN